MLNTPSGSMVSLASLVLITLTLTACQTTPAPTHAIKVTVTRGFNDYQPVAGEITNAAALQSGTLRQNISPSVLSQNNLSLTGAQNTQPSKNTPNASLSSTRNDYLSTTPSASAIENLNVQQNFDYSSTQDVAVKLSVFNPNTKAYSGVPIAVFGTDSPKALLQGVTNTNGVFEQMIRVPAHVKNVNVQVSAIGIDNSASLPIQAGKVIASFGNAPTN